MILTGIKAAVRYELLCLPELLDVTLRFEIFAPNLTLSLSSTV